MSIEAATSDIGARVESPISAVSWPAVISGAAVTISVSLILCSLGAGFGLAGTAFWPGIGPAATTLTLSLPAGIWLILMQGLSAASGGYMTGRLRTLWVGIRTREVSFRDAVHGLLTWALAMIVVAALTANAGANLVSARNAQVSSASLDYWADMLFRPGPTGRDDAIRADRLEAGRILEEGLAAGALTEEDSAYLIRIVAARTGISPLQAKDRLERVWAEEAAMVRSARQVRETAHDASARFSILLALSLLVGALIASAAAALGGRQRDEQS